MLERTTQPMTDAVERPQTLIEKLEEIYDMLCCKAEDEEDECFASTYRANVDGFKWALDIVKQHSDWISVDERLPTENDGRVSWGVNAYKKYILVNIVSRRVAMTCRFNLTDKCFETADEVTHWQPMPKLPSEVQDNG